MYCRFSVRGTYRKRTYLRAKNPCVVRAAAWHIRRTQCTRRLSSGRIIVDTSVGREYPIGCGLFFIFISGAAIVATESRSALICAVIVMLGFGVRSLMEKRKHTLVVVGMILIFVAIAIAGLMQYRSITLSRPPSIYENRLLYWRVGLGEFLKRPILGYGAETEEVIYDNAMKLEHVNLVNFMIDRSHNVFLDVALWSGSIGLLLFIGWTLSIFYGISKKRDKGAMRRLLRGLFLPVSSPSGVVHWVQLILLSVSITG